MDKNKSQHFNFCHEALPVLFHSQTKGFFEFLERDGLKFLKFWWDHVGERLDDSKCSSFAGTQFEIRELPEKKARVVLVRLPTPTTDFEFYMMALIRTPERRLPMVRLPNTRVFALERVPTEMGANGTLLVEITPRGRMLRVGAGPKPSLQTFYNTVLKYVWKKDFGDKA